MLKSLKSRVLLVLVVWLALSHLASLWLYARKHEEAASLLQDALVADKIALVTRLLDQSSGAERARLLAILSSPLGKVKRAEQPFEPPPNVEGTRTHLFEHLVGLFLDRPDHAGIKTEQSLARDGSLTLMATLSATLNPAPHHLPAGVLEEIRSTGMVRTGVALSDGATIEFATPLLTVDPFSLLKIWGPLAAMLLSVLVSGAWMISRATQPLMALARAANRLGTDIHAAPLQEIGAAEVRAAARAFNIMQDRIQRLVEDRTAFAAALAHDIGTPVTRLVLRLDDLPESEQKARIASDIGQMQRMVRATLDFARMDFEAEATERVDIVALVQSIADDMADAGADMRVEAPQHLTIVTKPVVLRRAVTNIADNAVKYGRGAVIRVSKAVDHPTRLDIVIEDRGPGIAPHLQEEAFRPFRRLDTPNGEAVEGTGLGLAVARSVARSLGGNVTLANRSEGGLRVTLQVPC